MTSTSALPAAYKSLSLHGKVALITGGSSGIGAATALLFAARGAKVLIAARRQVESDALIKKISAAGGTASFIQTDVAKEADVQAAVQAAVSRYGRLDVAFNNAGVMGPNGALHEQSAEALQSVLAVNVTALYLCMKYELQQFLLQAKVDGVPDVKALDHSVQPNGYARQVSPYSIINNASIFGEVGLPTYAAYCATKHAVLGLTKSAAVEYSKRGVRINAVNYGYVVSEITGKAALSFMLPHVPMGRLGQGEEAAEAVAFLASDASTFMTGSAMTVDGGVSCVTALH